MRRERYAFLGLLLFTVAVYWPVAHYGYSNFDDWAYASQNPNVHEGLKLAGVRYAFETMLLGNWHPVTWLSLMLDCQLFGRNAGAHHLVNVFFHAANTLLLLQVLREMTRQFWPSVVVAALFALHPLHVESVAWISERKDVLSTFFGLLTIWAYARYTGRVRRRVRSVALDIRQPANGAQAPAVDLSCSAWAVEHSTRYYLLALLFFALGLMSKSMLVTWPFVMLLLDWWPLGRVPGFQVRVLGFSFGVARMYAGQGAGEEELALREKPETWWRLMLEKVPFLVMTVAISAVTLFAQRAAGAMSEADRLTLGMRVSNAVVSYARYIWKTLWPENLSICYPYQLAWSGWAIGGSLLLILLITVGAIVQLGRRPWLAVGWLLFLGTLVPVIGLVQVGSQAMADRYMYIPSVGLFLMLAWGGQDWVRSRPLMEARVAGLVVVLLLMGSGLATRAQLRHWQSGEALFRHALEVTDNNVIAEYGMGEALMNGGKRDAAFRHFQRAVYLKADFFPARARVAELLSHQGKIREAIREYREALRYEPELAVALNNLAYILATSDDPEVRNGPEAVELAERACKSIPYQAPFMVPSDLDTLAAAYACVGRFEEAVQTAEKARDAAMNLGQKARADHIARNIELYRSGTPLRQKL